MSPQLGFALLLLIGVGILPEQCEGQLPPGRRQGPRCYFNPNVQKNANGLVAAEDLQQGCPPVLAATADNCYSISTVAPLPIPSSYGCGKKELADCLEQAGYKASGCQTVKIGLDRTDEEKKFQECMQKFQKEVTDQIAELRKQQQQQQQQQQQGRQTGPGIPDLSVTFRVCICESDLCNSVGRDRPKPPTTAKPSGAKSGRPEYTTAILMLISGVVAVGSCRLGGSFTGA